MTAMRMRWQSWPSSACSLAGVPAAHPPESSHGAAICVAEHVTSRLLSPALICGRGADRALRDHCRQLPFVDPIGEQRRLRRSAGFERQKRRLRRSGDAEYAAAREVGHIQLAPFVLAEGRNGVGSVEQLNRSRRAAQRILSRDDG